MSLAQWFSFGWLIKHETSKNEIKNLQKAIERDIADCKSQGLSADRKMFIAYEAALKSAKAALASEGYQPSKDNSQHMRMLESLEFTVKIDSDSRDLLEGFRTKRHRVGYDMTGVVSEQEANEMLELAEKIFSETFSWLKRKHSELF